MATYTTPDKRWTYGTDTITRSVSKINVAGYLPSYLRTAAAWLYVKGIDWFKSAYPQYVTYTSFKVYRIWAKGPSDYGKPRIGGEWTIATGGKAARDYYFNKVFRPLMNAQPAFGADGYRVSTLAGSASAAASVSPSVSNVTKALGAPSAASKRAGAPKAPPSGGGYMVPLLIAGAALLFIFLRR